MKVPVLFIAFNRPHYTKESFQKIKEYQPNQLFIAIDGPRDTHPTDQNKIEKTKKIILENIDWDCEIKTLIHKTNIGCGRGPAQAIDWLFEQVERGVIIEDDCICDASFFSFCEAMLRLYQSDEKVMHISGCNFLKQSIDQNYYISKYNPVAAWATWKRAWSLFDYTINHQKTESFYKERLYSLSKKEVKQWRVIFDMVNQDKREDIWDYQWTYHIWKNNGICIQSGKNLVSNIGFGGEGTHMSHPDFSPDVGHLPIEKIDDINYKIELNINHALDKTTFKNFYLFRKPKLLRRLLNYLYSLSPVYYNRLKKIFK